MGSYRRRIRLEMYRSYKYRDKWPTIDGDCKNNGVPRQPIEHETSRMRERKSVEMFQLE